MEAALKTAKEVVAVYGLSVIAAIAIFLVGKWLARILTNTLTCMMKRAGTDDTLISFVVNIAYVAMMVFVVIAVMSDSA